MISEGVKERVKVIPEILPMVRFLFEDDIEIEVDSMITKKVDKATATSIIEATIAKFETMEDFSLAEIEKNLKEVVSDLELKMGAVFVTVRIAVTGAKATPPLFDSILALGKEKVLKRLSECLGLL